VIFIFSPFWFAHGGASANPLLFVPKSYKWLWIERLLEENEFLPMEACLPFTYLLPPPPHKEKIEKR
jgi:hypothetical protein